jgi:hypothetical protein
MIYDLQEVLEALPQIFEAREERWHEVMKPLMADVLEAQVRRVDRASR